MIKRSLLFFAVVAAIVALVFVLLRDDPLQGWFESYPLPLEKSYRLFDLGVVDANNDGLLDIYSSNHHFRQALLIAEGGGSYTDVVSSWGLDQSQDFPLAELSAVKPAVDRPGLYIYWLGTRIVFQTHELPTGPNWRGTMITRDITDPTTIVKDDGFGAELNKLSRIETSVEFSAPSGEAATLVINPGGQGLPFAFDLDASIPLQQVFVGRGKVAPDTHRFSLTMQDRHGFAWADLNDDGRLDAFVTRGALGGKLILYPQELASAVQDELLLSGSDGRFTEAGMRHGISKRGCSGRHTRWLDVNRDGLLDLFINCYDRQYVAGEYPKQLYQQDARGRFHDQASRLNLGIPDYQFGSFTWMDLEGDGDTDLITLEDTGFFLYRNEPTGFTRETLYERPLDQAAEIGTTTGDDWLFDGKLTVSDYDADGDLDLFSASKRGNVLLRNDAGEMKLVVLDAPGLPRHSLSAAWVDYDNDGRPDLHLVPQGIFRQGEDGRFQATGLLAFDSGRYRAAIVNWLDFDNDGRQDALLALSEHPDYQPPWYAFGKKKKRRGWEIKGYRNGAANGNWLQIKLVGGRGNRPAVGAQVELSTPAGRQLQEVGSTDGAFFSQGHYRLYYGLGEETEVGPLAIRWSDGQVQTVQLMPVNRLLTISRTKPAAD